MILVDASVWIDYLRGTSTPQSDWLDQELSARPFGLTDLTLCEVLQGVSDREAADVRDRLLLLSVFPTGGTELALAASDNYRRLRDRGFTIRKTIDCWIATFCLREDHTLLHRDRDFDPFERFLGLQVVHP